MNFSKNEDSVTAINQYILAVRNKGDDLIRHKAMVLTQGEGYPVSKYVGVVEESGYISVIVENLPSKFVTGKFQSNEYDFEYHPTAKVLVIKGIKDLSGNDLEININVSNR